MKECPQGHLYPETLDHCPVCEKGLEFQTVFESKPEGTGALEKAAGGHKAANQLAEKLANKSSLNRNQEKTVFLGGDAATKEHFVIGWLIELNNLEIPINSYQLINDETITVGRGQDNHIALKNKTVSRKHCHIEVKNRKII
ncbi:FHA domain-containing protein, partial [bacterium]|nr:FHA domain-containing protein [bacterium]